jgi:hypothetical protein
MIKQCMLKAFLLSLVILIPAILLMGYRVFFTQKGKFPGLHVDSNAALREKGIHCVQTQDKEARKQKTNQIKA